MKVSTDELSGSDVKLAIMETFQDFTVSKNIIDEPQVEKVSTVKKKVSTKEAKAKSKTTEEKKQVKTIEKSAKEKQEKISKSDKNSKTDKDDELQKSENAHSKSPSKSISSKSAQIEKLKSYVFKCGVRKVWKKELEGLSEAQSISKIQSILRELGIEGKPSLEQCKAIKAKREFEAEMREIDTSNIIEGKRRRIDKDFIAKKLIISDSEDEGEVDRVESESDISGSETGSEDTKLDLSALGDSESD